MGVPSPTFYLNTGQGNIPVTRDGELAPRGLYTQTLLKSCTPFVSPCFLVTFPQCSSPLVFYLHNLSLFVKIVSFCGLFMSTYEALHSHPRPHKNINIK